MKKYFYKLYEARYKAKMLQAKIGEKKGSIFSIKGIPYDKEMIKTNVHYDLASLFEEIEELEIQLKKIEKDVNRLKKHYKSEIKKATNNKLEQNLLTLYYIENFKVYQIAFILNYSERQTMRIKRKADEKLKKYIENVM